MENKKITADDIRIAIENAKEVFIEGLKQDIADGSLEYVSTNHIKGNVTPKTYVGGSDDGYMSNESFSNSGFYTFLKEWQDDRKIAILENQINDAQKELDNLKARKEAAL